MLADDKKFFAVYNPSFTIRQSVYQAHPEIEKVIDPIAKALDMNTMQQMNANVDVKGDAPEDVAKKFLKDKGLVK